MSSFKDRHGKERLRFRRKGFPSGYFKSALGTEDFRGEYRAFMDANAPDIAVRRAALGSIDELVTRYFAVPERLGPTLSTQKRVRSVIDRFRTQYGALPTDRLTFEHVDRIISERRIKRAVGKRMEGGVAAAKSLRKELIRLFMFGIKTGMMTINPAEQSAKVKVAPSERSKGWHTWTEGEIQAYRARHPLGTKARLALELLLWTGQRRGDAIRMGPQHIRNGFLDFGQRKTGKELVLPVAPPLLDAIVAVPPSAKEHLCFLVNDYGRPFSDAGFGNRMRKWCNEADLPQCSAHGLRKAMQRRLAELGMSNQSLKSVSGHSGDAEVALYTRAADQKRMATDAISALARWEMSNLSQRLDTSPTEVARE